jgi:hypothetical protein
MSCVVKTGIDFGEEPAKLVGRRKPVSGTLGGVAGGRARAEDWRRAFGGIGVPKGVYRFKSHKEADEWMWKMIVRRKRGKS